MSGQQHGFVPLDKAGEVIRPAKLWCDTSTVAECEVITEKLGGPSRPSAALGNAVLPGFTASKILWLKKHEPENYQRLATVLLPHDYLNFWLTGRRLMEYGDASGTALLDVRRRKWSSAVLEAIDPELAGKLPSLMPQRPARRHVAGLHRQDARLEPRRAGQRGRRRQHDGRHRHGQHARGRGHRQLRHQRHDLRLRGKAGGRPAGRNRRLLRLDQPLAAAALHHERHRRHRDGARGFRLVAREVRRRGGPRPAGARGLVLLPYLEGERTPNVPEGTGVWFGVNQKTFEAGHFARAAMEGVTMGMNYGLRRLAELGVKPRQIRVTGGGAKSPVWRQIMADIFDAEVVTLKVSEGAAYGAALQALWCWRLQQGEKVSISELTDQFVILNAAERAEPDAKNVAVYRELQGVQDQMSEALRKTFKQHRQFLLRAS